jgi:methionine biosynthesis protein MetW
MTDNRNYIYSANSVSKRGEFEVILKWIEAESSVVDLGSGDGTLLKLLKDKKKTKGEGIEISPSGVKVAKKKGIRSKVGRIDVKLPFKDKEFDYAICNVTLQMVMYPEVLLSEMKRISKKQIITFPNFAFILNRLDLLINGVMPRFMIPGYKWYCTGHIHQLSIKDFENFCKNNNLRIVGTSHIGPGRFTRIPSGLLVKIAPNIFASMGIFLLEEGNKK